MFSCERLASLTQAQATNSRSLKTTARESNQPAPTFAFAVFPKIPLQ